MPLPKYYNTGTISVANGSTAVAGVGTAWLNVIKADDVLRKAGHSVRVASVASHGALTLAEPWPGATLAGASYEIAIIYDGPEFQLRTRELLEQLNVLETSGRGIVQKYATATADADPGSGYFRLNNATMASVTAAYLDNEDIETANIAAEIDSWDDSMSTIKGKLWVRSIAVPSTFHAFNVTGSVVDGTGYRKLTLAYVGGSGTPTADDEMMLFFASKGDSGTLTLPIRSNDTTETLTAANSQGKLNIISAACTKTLPLLSAVENGGIFGFHLNAAAQVTIQRQGADQLSWVTNASINAVTLCNFGDFVYLVADTANGRWRVLSEGIMGPHFVIRKSGNQSISASTFTKVAFDSETTDLWGAFDPTTNYRFTCSIPGMYLFSAGVYLGDQASGNRFHMVFYKNGVAARSGTRAYSQNDAVATITCELFMAVGDYVEAFCWTDVAATVKPGTIAEGTFFTGTRIR